ncbi:MAG: peptidoglycan-binding protein [Rhodococcus sp. (in: high G+C Gram-positive bacteria)]|nr:MAG: peptidoglycan-binding protein [Rhodococcus sp. (in: high G+C Gram-positive bacteria)]
MPEPASITRAKLQEIRLADGDRPSQVTNDQATVEVQFNPESLKVTYSNTVAGGDQSGGAAIQYVSKSSTKLTAELWFDASATANVADVRELTKKVNHFFVPVRQGEGLAPPAVRFLWGSFLFEGVMESMDETLEFFSAEGRPLRAKVALSIASQDIQFQIQALAGAPAPGTRPQAPASEGEGLQQMLGRSGDPSGWVAVASANGIENPRILTPGSFVDLAAGRGTPNQSPAIVRR